MPWYPRPRAWFMRGSNHALALRTEDAAGGEIPTPPRSPPERRLDGERSGRGGGEDDVAPAGDPAHEELGEFGPVVGLVVEPVEEDEGVPRRGGGGGVHGGVRG